MRGGRPVETILGQEGFSRLARRSISVYEADRLQPGPATGTPRRRFLEWNGSSPLSESAISRYAGGGAAAAKYEFVRAKVPDAAVGEMHGRIRYCPKSSISMRIRSRWETSDRRGQSAGGVRRPEGPGSRAGLPSEATRQHTHRIPLSDRFTPRADNASVQRTEGAPADRIGDQCQGARGWCRRLAVHPSVPRHTDGADHQDQPRADADSQIGNVIDERTRCSSSPETLNSHSTVPRPIRRFRTCR